MDPWLFPLPPCATGALAPPRADDPSRENPHSRYISLGAPPQLTTEQADRKAHLCPPGPHALRRSHRACYPKTRATRRGRDCPTASAILHIFVVWAINAHANPGHADDRTPRRNPSVWRSCNAPERRAMRRVRVEPPVVGAGVALREPPPHAQRDCRDRGSTGARGPTTFKGPGLLAPRCRHRP